MKTAFLAMTAILVLSFNASAETPYARQCRISGGQQWTVSIDSPFDTTLCLFDTAAIGAAEFAQYKWGQGEQMSLKSFLAQQTPKNPTTSTCDSVGASYKTATDSNNTTWELCKFMDGSVIEVGTLAGGVNSPENIDLVKALQ